MTPLEFLAVVLPSPGHGVYCAAELSSGRKEHKFEESIDALIPHIDRWHGEKKNVFVAMSTFDEAVLTLPPTEERRTRKHSRFIKALFIDMDGYESKKAAATALDSFMFKTGLDLLGMPWLVSSGGGIHAYWPLTEDVPVDEWRPIGDALKRLCVQEEMRIDMSVTADSARVMRAVGTTNFKPKYPKPLPVRILATGDTFDFHTIAEHIKSCLKTPLPAPAPSSLSLPGQRPTSVNPPTPTSLALTQNSVTKFKTILTKTKDGVGCGQLAYFIEHAEDDGMEPLWRAHLSIAQKCVEADKAVVWLSQLHPYDNERMQQKLSQIKGPYACAKFDELMPGICTSCQHWGKITNPLGLGREMALTTTAPAVEIEVPALNGKAAEKRLFEPPEAPRGYAYGERGGVFLEKEDTDAQGNVTKKQVMLLPYSLYPVDILNNGGDHLVHMVGVRPTHVQTVMLPQKVVASKDETIKHLMNQNVVASFGAGNDVNLFGYVRACVEKLSTEKCPIRVPTSYGWQDDDTYVFAGRIFAPHKEPVRVPMPGLENIILNTQPTGSLEVWRNVVQMMIRRKLYPHLTILLFGLAAPLMPFTGIFGMTVHCASRESGTGKSLALDLAASVWGHPIHYRTGSGTSAVAMQQRLGLLKNNPLITDEITTNNRVDFEWFPAFIFSMSEGRGKERMESGANKERLNLSVWQTIALMSSNRAALDYLIGVRQHSSEGELRRLLEFNMDDKLEWTAEEIEVIKSLQQNYAVAGKEFVQYMVNNIDLLRTLVPDTVRQMYKEFNAPNDERFWMAGIGSAIAAGILLNSQHAGIIDLPLKPIIESIRVAVNNARASIVGGKRTAEDVLNSFIQEYQGRLVVVKYGEHAGAAAQFSDGTLVGRNTTRAEVMGRVEFGVKAGYVDFYIEERILRAYCSNMSFSYAALKRQLEAQFDVSYVLKKDMMAKTDAPPMRVAAIKISRRTNEQDEETSRSLSVGHA